MACYVSDEQLAALAETVETKQPMLKRCGDIELTEGSQVPTCDDMDAAIADAIAEIQVSSGTVDFIRPVNNTTSFSHIGSPSLNFQVDLDVSYSGELIEVFDSTNTITFGDGDLLIELIPQYLLTRETGTVTPSEFTSIYLLNSSSRFGSCQGQIPQNTIEVSTMTGVGSFILAASQTQRTFTVCVANQCTSVVQYQGFFSIKATKL